jgi:hypothetical protein
VNGEDSSLFKLTTVVVDNTNPSPDVYEESNGTHKKRVKINPQQANLAALPDGTNIFVPYGALPDNTGPLEVIIQEVMDTSAGIGGAVDIQIIGVEKFSQDLVISIPYPDANNDGIVDGTNTDENDLVLKWYNPDTSQWEPVFDSVVYPDENYLSGKTNHLSLFGVGTLGTIGAAAGGGAASLGGEKNVSYCFIATAAYGTPFAKEVIALREFRDKLLMTNDIGRRFVRYYYRYSPPIARFIENKPKLRAIVRLLLKPVIKMAKVMVR